MKRNKFLTPLIDMKLYWIAAAVWAVAFRGSSRAGVAVIANRCAEAVAVSVLVEGEQPSPLSLAPGDARPLFADGPVRLRIDGDRAQREFLLEAECAYFVGGSAADGTLTLEQIGLGETMRRPWRAASPPAVARAEDGVVTVKILVDENETRLRSVWEPVIRQRIADASQCLAAHGGAALEVVSVETWDSDDRQTDFEQSLREFEREVSPLPAQVAIGFSSQYVIVRGQTHMGGTRGPLHSHILIKEQARNVRETERLELLVHELGHFFGATHSGEATSVMRPVVGQGHLRVKGAEIQFDPPNVLLVALVGQEIRHRGVRRLSQLSTPTRLRMAEIYNALAPVLPDDSVSGRYLRLVAPPVRAAGD